MKKLLFVCILFFIGLSMSGQEVVQFNRDSVDRILNPFTGEWDLVRKGTSGNFVTQGMLDDTAAAIRDDLQSPWSVDVPNSEVYTTDQVGIGTADPTEMLHVNGNINLPTTSSTVGVLKFNSIPFLHSYGTENTFIGANAGNLSLSGATNNVAIGDSALKSITTGSYSIAIGSNVMKSQDVGSGNVGIGFESLKSLNSTTPSNGRYNLAVGYQSLYSLTTGQFNIGIGYQSLYSATNGQFNVAIGYQAGYNETGSNKLYIENSNSTTPLIGGDFAADSVRINGALKVSSNIKSGVGTIADGDATPDVSGGNTFIYAGSTTSVTITDFDNPVVNSYITIIGNSDTYTVTINDSGNFNTSETIVLGADDVVTFFVVADNNYIQSGKLVNN